MPDACEVVYEDDRLIAVNKPVGVESQGLVTAFPGTWLWHRLDQPVSGLLILGKTPAPMEFRKFYLAVVYRSPPPDQTLINHLKHDQRHNITRVARDGKESSLTYTTIQAGDRSLLEIELHTGRHHQIRAQLSHLGHPIVNDAKYGGKRNRAKGIALHAYKVILPDRELIVLPTSAFFQPFTLQ